jgi:DNA processing protein
VSLDVAGRLSADLAARGVTVGSGLARGVDSAAHRGALKAGRTVAVLGSGVDRVYPREHEPLAADIARLGCVLSEYPPGAPALPFHFPMRNRLISGLSRAVVVIEASERSGSLITAACALEQGRDVMAVPGTVAGGRNTGGHALIRDGATIVECADDVFRELGLSLAVPGLESIKSTTRDSSGDYLLSKMHVGEPYDLDDLASASGVGAPRLLPHLSALELDGRVRRIEGGRFMRVS